MKHKKYSLKRNEKWKIDSNSKLIEGGYMLLMFTVAITVNYQKKMKHKKNSLKRKEKWKIDWNSKLIEGGYMLLMFTVAVTVNYQKKTVANWRKSLKHGHAYFISPALEWHYSIVEVLNK